MAHQHDRQIDLSVIHDQQLQAVLHSPDAGSVSPNLLQEAYLSERHAVGPGCVGVCVWMGACACLCACVCVGV